MENVEPNFGFFYHIKEGLFLFIESILGVTEEKLQDAVNSVQELDNIISEWIIGYLDVTPSNLLVSVAVIMFLIFLMVAWCNRRAEDADKEKLAILDGERTLDSELVTLYKSKAILRHLIEQIDSFQDDARKQVMKDAMALAMLNDRIEVLNEILTEMCIFRPGSRSGHLCLEHSGVDISPMGDVKESSSR